MKPAWVNGGLRITRSALARVSEAGIRAYARNEEACGYLNGPADDALFCDDATELQNLANKYHAVDPEGHPRTGAEYFEINALAFSRAIESGVAAARPVKVFFHSHVDVGAYFSEEDALAMTMGGGEAPTHDLAYLVSSVERGQLADHRLFVWNADQKRFTEAAFEVVD